MHGLIDELDGKVELMGRWMAACMCGWTDRSMDCFLGGWMAGCLHGRVHGWMDGWMDEWMDGWMDGLWRHPKKHASSKHDQK